MKKGRKSEMRHVKIPNHPNRPYEGAWGYHTYNFTSPTKDRVYVRVLKFVETHPKCRRSDIQFGVWGNHNKSNSTLFAQMLYHDILDYNRNFEYRITRKGRSILKKVERSK